eukprot:TRINITY_DN67486_c0_g1_i3.p1 TRINITY_DN67486_c0_g1~~TRINITY_DN67486_c0_g1_i3.p1  ORF type:complete len:302 (-),score=15.02 TRINITY_DN67486_c0_g1_i3:262-1131(-)
MAAGSPVIAKAFPSFQQGEIELDKAEEQFRVYSDENTRVRTFYHTKNSRMTMENTVSQMKKLQQLGIRLMVWECLEMLEEIDDESDPDTTMAQIEHAYQTAEALRRLYPDDEYDWLHLTGLLHDLGKIVCHPKFGSAEQWNAVGDTYPMGCQFSPKVVHAEAFENNPDSHNPEFNTKFGIYQESCGLRNVTMAWGHDEYMYRILSRPDNRHKLPDEALAIIRFHSFYAWHTSNEYDHLCDDHDHKMKKWVKAFQQCDLYSKSEVPINREEVRKYYNGLIMKYLPKYLNF